MPIWWYNKQTNKKNTVRLDRPEKHKSAHDNKYSFKTKPVSSGTCFKHKNKSMHFFAL